jgi:hypothetical protein
MYVLLAYGFFETWSGKPFYLKLMQVCEYLKLAVKEAHKRRVWSLQRKSLSFGGCGPFHYWYRKTTAD